MSSKPVTAARGPEGCVVRRARNGKTKIVKTGGWRWSLQAEKVFLEHLAATANVRAASAEAGFSTTAVYKQRMTNPGFAARWQEALETGVARLEMLLVHSAGATLEGLPLDGDQTGERGSIQLDPKKLTPEQRADHAVLLEIRNRALAHVYRDNPIADNFWHEALVFAVGLAEHGWKPAAGSNRISFHVPTFDRLLRQIPIADALLVRTFHKRMNAMTRKMNEAAAPIDLFLRFRFDPVQRFGGVKAVENILAGIPVGHATVITNRP